MNEQTWETVRRWRRQGVPAAVATVVRTRRSAPRPLGSVFAVAATGEMAGSVSGGCVEGAVALEARALLADPEAAPRLLHYGIADDLALEVGLACGGELWVALAHDRGRPALRRGAIVTAVSGAQAGRRLVLDADAGTVDGDLEGGLREAGEHAGRRALAGGRSAPVDRGEEGLLFVEAVGPPPRVVVVGAVDTAEAVCGLARVLGWRTVVVDPRARFATAARLPSAETILVRWPEEAFAELPLEPDDAVVVLAHDPKVDDPALAAALAVGAWYVGALGSRRTQAQRRDRLLAAGLDTTEVDRVRGPVGLDIGADTPAETGVSIVAEIVAARAGRDGGPLPTSDGRIHAARSTAT